MHGHGSFALQLRRLDCGRKQNESQFHNTSTPRGPHRSQDNRPAFWLYAAKLRMRARLVRRRRRPPGLGWDGTSFLYGLLVDLNAVSG